MKDEIPVGDEQECSEPDNGSRFDAIIDGVSQYPGQAYYAGEGEIEAMRDIIETLWQLLEPEQEVAFFDHATIRRIEKEAKRYLPSE